MSKQVIISISREYGSGGRYIAEELAKKLDIGFYDSNMLRDIAAEHNADSDALKRFDEIPKSIFGAATVHGISNSPEEAIASLQFDYMRKLADEGKSFVVVGRCSEYILSEYEGLVSIFILGDLDNKIKAVMGYENCSAAEAEKIIKVTDKRRKVYHNYYATNKWGDSRGYDLCINSSKLGLEKTVDLITEFVKQQQK